MLLDYFSFAWKYFLLDTGRQAKILQNCTKSDFASNMGFICLEIFDEYPKKNLKNFKGSQWKSGGAEFCTLLPLNQLQSLAHFVGWMVFGQELCFHPSLRKPWLSAITPTIHLPCSHQVAYLLHLPT
jgi:hypothetical protein